MLLLQIPFLARALLPKEYTGREKIVTMPTPV